MLYYAVNILKSNPEILKYYQNICRYIIEDEAQDSTQIQQNLINMLAGKHKNIIRCGDINQSITSTFTNSDMLGFKEFISNNKKIEMKSSQRCAKPIYDYANNFIKRVSQNDELKNAFYYIQMQGTDKNPQSEEKPLFNIFEREAEEKLYILNKIKEIHKKNPKASVGILLRLNSQVNEYNEYFQNNGIKTLVRSDCPERKKIFRIITSLLKAVENPLNNKNISESEKYILEHYKFIKEKQFKINYLKCIETSLKEKNCLKNYKWKFSDKLNIAFILYVFSFLLGYYLALKYALSDNVTFFAIEMIMFLITIIVVGISMKDYDRKNKMVKTSIGKDIYLKLNGLKKYIKDFGNFEERNLKEIALWEEYILYAIILNESKTLTEQAKDEYLNLVNIVY